MSIDNQSFTYGFEVNGITYGWYKKELYRLACKNFFNIKKMKLNKKCYRINGCALGMHYLEIITVELSTIKQKEDNLPF